METISSSLIPKLPPSLYVSSPKTEKNPHLKLTLNSSLIPFHFIKKFITQISPHKKNSSTLPQKTLLHATSTKQQSSLHELIFKPLNDLIISTFNHYAPPLPPGFDPERVLSGNFSPVDELPPIACHVTVGSLPPCLDGAFIQNGANPQFFPRGPYHLADGDGMLHSVMISRERAVFCSRFVRTFKYALERDLGYSVIPNFLATFANSRYDFIFWATLVLYVARVVTGQLDPLTNGIGTANTSLALFGGHLFALVESDLPYSIKITSDGDIITLGRHDFRHSGTESFVNITAHPKVDRETNELFAFRYFITKPYLTFFRIDSNGRKQNDVPIFSMKSASFVHDFALTKNYVVFPDVQIVTDPFGVIRGKPVVRVDTHKIPRLGFMPRYATDESEMCWIDVPGLNILHVVNAWEEDGGESIVMMAANGLSFEHFLQRMDLMHVSLEMIVIDTKAKKVVMRRPVSGTNLEFGVINPKYEGKKNRYIYASIVDKTPKMAGVVKIDLSLLVSANNSNNDCTVASRIYGAGCYGGQTVFVARAPNNLAAEEDDGYLLSFVHNENTHESHFFVMDAKSPSLEIIAAVKLPRRVPYGFHSIFVKESDINKL